MFCTRVKDKQKRIDTVEVVAAAAAAIAASEYSANANVRTVRISLNILSHDIEF